jgi:hypothetical protein
MRTRAEISNYEKPARTRRHQDPGLATQPAGAPESFGLKRARAAAARFRSEGHAGGGACKLGRSVRQNIHAKRRSHPMLARRLVSARPDPPARDPDRADYNADATKSEPANRTAERPRAASARARTASGRLNRDYMKLTADRRSSA